MAYSGESESESEFYPDSDEDIRIREDEPLTRKKWDAAQVRIGFCSVGWIF